MISSLCLFLLASAVAPAVKATTPVQATATVAVLVTDRSGKPLPSAHVVVNGVSERKGNTNKAGRIVFTNMKAGSYMLRVERDKFITFEKEFAVGGQRRSTPVVAALSSVASLPARPSKTTASARPVVSASSRSGQTPVSLVGEDGTPQIVSIPDLVEKNLIGHRSVKESPIGCSGLTGARLIQVTEPLSDHRHADAEEMLYVVAGEAALTIGGKTETVKSGWFSIIPRGVPYALVRTGRNPVILLSVLGSQPCKSTGPRLYAEAQSAQTR